MDKKRLPEVIKSQNNQHRGDDSGEGQGAIETVNRVDFPKLYRVLLINDDYTPMEFVTMVLRRFFAKSEEQATQIMLDVHKKGAGLAGVFTLEMAEMKVMQVSQLARVNQHPLKCTLEPEGV